MARRSAGARGSRAQGLQRPAGSASAGAASRDHRGARRLLPILWALPILAACLANVGVLRNDFAYDDIRVIQALREHRITLTGSSLLPLHDDASVNPPVLLDQESRRLTYALHLLDYRLWGEAPFGFHLTNLVLHMLATALVYAAARLFTRMSHAALVAALVFAVHPLHVEVVASFANRKDILALIVALATLLVWVGIRPLAPRLLATGALMILGFEAKEVAVVALPVFLVAAHDLLGRKGEEAEPRPWQIWTLRSLAGGLGLLVMAGLLAGERLPLFNHADVRSVTEGQLHDYGAVLANAVLGMLRLVRLLIVPVGLSADYPLVTATLATPAALLGLATFTALIVLPLGLYRRHARVALAAGWLIIMYLPISNLVPLVHFFAADRYAYVPSFGYCLLLGVAVEHLHRRASAHGHGRRLIVAGVGLLLALLTALTVRRVADWKDDVTLWSSASRAGFETYRIRHKLGVALLLAGDANADAAARELSRAVALRPDSREDHMWLAGAFFAGNRLTDAWREANAALQIDPADAVSRFIRGEVLLQRGDTARALEDYRAAIAADSSHVGAMMRVAMIDLAQARERPGDLDEALTLARRAAQSTTDGNIEVHRQALGLVTQAEAAIRARGD